MAKLTTAARKKLPAKDYGLSAEKGSANEGKYPMPDRKHAAVAKAYASRFATPSEKVKIDAKANKVLGKKK